MDKKVAVRLASRPSRTPIRNLPATVELPADATVEDLKRVVARAAAIRDHNRIGLFLPDDAGRPRTIKDRHARVAGLGPAESAPPLLLQVKDLGAQIDWRTVFVIEYGGPIALHGLGLAARPLLWPGAPPLSAAQRLGAAMIVAHFVKRELETVFVHRFSANTMPARNVFKNSFFYWALAGAAAAVELYYCRAPLLSLPFSASPSSSGSGSSPLLLLVGAALFLSSEAFNAIVHLHLAGLRAPGTTERRIPHGYGFGLVTCPNYMSEVLAWVGVVVATRSLACAVFIAVGAWQMRIWAIGKERAYRREFGDRYKPKRWVMLPGLI